MIAEGKKGGKGYDREFGVVICTLLCLKWIANKDLLHSTGQH